MLIPVRNKQGETIGSIQVKDALFGVPFNMAVVHQALVRQQANARVGTAQAKTRGEVDYSTRKLYSQKHTGWARAGSRGSPTRHGGGVAFPPRPRSYRQRMPKKMRRLALKCVLSQKLREGNLIAVDDILPEQPKTKLMKQMLHNLNADHSAMIVTERAEPAVIQSAQNIPQIKTLPAPLLNVADLLKYEKLIMTVGAIRKAEEIWS